MTFSEDGKYILSSAVGERYIAVWRVGGSKKQSASCVLSMDHPAVFLDSRCVNSEGDDGAGLDILAISENGVCYFWFGLNIEQLRNAKPTKISISSEDISSKNYKGALPIIFAARLQGSAQPASGQVFVAYGSLVKPSFQKILVHYGTDVKLSSSSDGVLLPMTQSLVKSKKGRDMKSGGRLSYDFGNDFMFFLLCVQARNIFCHMGILRNSLCFFIIFPILLAYISSTLIIFCMPKVAMLLEVLVLAVLLPYDAFWSCIVAKIGFSNELSVIALDRANAEDALLPIPKVYEGRNRNKTLSVNPDERKPDLVDSRSHDGLAKSKGKD